MPKYPIKQHKVTVPAQIAERFLVWALDAATQAVPFEAIELTMPKPNGEPYSDTTFHTQMNTVLKNEEWLRKYPILQDFELHYVQKETTLFITKDHRPTTGKDTK